jgi:hypothetical protein
MADNTKEDMKANFIVKPLTTVPGLKEFLKDNPSMMKKFEKLEYTEKVNLDKRKWSEKKLNEGIAALARYELKIMSMRLPKLIKSGKGDKKKLQAEVLKEYEDLKKEILDKISLAVEEVASGKGDNKKALKDCKTAFDRMSKANFNGAFDRPRKVIISSLDGVLKELSKGDKGKPDFGKATKDVAAAVKGFEKTGKLAENGINSMLKTAKDLEKDKDADGELTGFATKILKYDKKFTQFTVVAKKFSDEIDAIEAALKLGEMDEKEVDAKIKSLSKMSNLDKTAQEIVSGTRKLKPEFLKIEKKLK